MSVPALVTT